MSLSGTAVHTLGQLRDQLAKLDDLPAETPLVIAMDDGNEEDSYGWIGDIDIALWDQFVRYELPDGPGGKREAAPDDAEKAIFIWAG